MRSASAARARETVEASTGLELLELRKIAIVISGTIGNGDGGFGLEADQIVCDTEHHQWFSIRRVGPTSPRRFFVGLLFVKRITPPSSC
jgi:hypothetical protein